MFKLIFLQIIFLCTKHIKGNYDANGICLGSLKVEYSTQSRECLCSCCSGNNCKVCTYNDFSESLSECQKSACESFECNTINTLNKCRYSIQKIDDNLLKQCVETKCGEIQNAVCSPTKITGSIIKSSASQFKFNKMIVFYFCSMYGFILMYC